MGNVIKKKTALVLGGGGAKGAYETGVWQALRELGTQIDCVYGTSIGSLTAAVIAQDNFDLCIDVWRELEAKMIFDIDLRKSEANTPLTGSILGNKGERFKSIREKALNKIYEMNIDGVPTEEIHAYLREVVKGGAGTQGLQDILAEYVDEDKIRRSGMEYGLVTVEFPTMTAHYMTLDAIPQGKLNDYIVASCSVFPALKPHEIDGKQYIDGGFTDSVPVSLALQSGATDIIAVDLKAPGVFRSENHKIAEETARSFKAISSPWDLGNMLAFNKTNARRLIRLGYLETLKAYEVFSGEYYTFPNKEFGKRDLNAADTAAKIFELDPTIIYTKASLNEALTKKANALLDKKGELKFEFGSIKTFIKDIISQKDGREIITLLIAEELNKPQPNPLVNSRTLARIIGEEITAARYLLAYDIV